MPTWRPSQTARGVRCEFCKTLISLCMKCQVEMCPNLECHSSWRCNHATQRWAVSHRFTVEMVPGALGTFAYHDNETGLTIPEGEKSLLTLVNQLAYELETIKAKFRSED